MPRQIGFFLLSRREAGELVADPGALPPLDGLADAYAIHSMMTKTMSGLGRHVGWKVGAAAPESMAALGLAEPFRAPIYEERVYRSGAVTLAEAAAGGRLLMVEAEFGFQLGVALPARGAEQGGAYSAEEAWAAVELVVPSLEVCATRWDGPALAAANGLQKVADGGLNASVVLGECEQNAHRTCTQVVIIMIPLMRPPLRRPPEQQTRPYTNILTIYGRIAGGAGAAVPARERPALGLDKLTVRLRVNGAEAAVGSGAAVLEHPASALAWLANHLNTEHTSTQSGLYGAPPFLLTFYPPSPCDCAIATLFRLEREPLPVGGGSVAGLQAGDFVMSGAAAVVLNADIPAGATVVAEFGSDGDFFGSVEVLGGGGSGGGGAGEDPVSTGSSKL